MRAPSHPVFTLEEARAVLPRVQEVTAVAARRFDELRRAAAATRDAEARRRAEQGMQQVARRWTEVVGALGGRCAGLWLVDFDNGAGYYCWKHPEEDLAWFHGYTDGFAGRLRIH